MLLWEKKCLCPANTTTSILIDYFLQETKILKVSDILLLLPGLTVVSRSIRCDHALVRDLAEGSKPRGWVSEVLGVVQHWPTRERCWGGMVRIREGECFGVPEGGGDMFKNSVMCLSGGGGIRWWNWLASADTLRSGDPLWKEMETGLKVEKWDPLSLCLGR